MDQKIILFYNHMWHDPLLYPENELPERYVITMDRSLMDEAAAVVFHLPTLPPGLFTNGEVGKNNGQIWVAWYMECEANYPHLDDPDFMSRFDLRMSHRLDADIFSPYFPPDFAELSRRPAPEKEPGKIVNAFISSHINKSGRLQYLIRMMKVIDVHSYGRMIPNMPPLDDYGHGFKLDTISKYKFTIAFENAIAADYVTEKFYDPLITGSVPVYLGAPNVSDFAPGDNCYIDASEWDDPESLARYLLDLSRDDARYMSYFEWKNKPFLSKFSQMLEIKKVHPFVRLCARIRELLESSGG
ncbi:MAG TPA: glycosyltransferase family 10 [Thermodesulfobacteriota bacterium]|nr:glycosyltransferase family 10 [Thermodesulfobacteriota bacterium]